MRVSPPAPDVAAAPARPGGRPGALFPRLIAVPSAGLLATLAGLAALYFFAGKLGLRLAYFHANASPVSPAAGIALVAFMLLGPRAWPAVLVGAFLVNVTTAGTAVTSLVIALGNTIEGAVGGYLVLRWAGARRFYEGARNVFKFTVLAGLGSTTVGATVGTVTLALGGFAERANLGSLWLTWWLGGATGILVVVPVILTWIAEPRVQWTTARSLEAIALLAGLGFTGQLVFGELSPLALQNYPMSFLCLPILLWAAFRFGPREAAAAVLLMSAMAIRGTLSGFGPFAGHPPNESLLLLQEFTAVAAVMTLIVAAVVSERRRVEVQLRELSVSDPLTGLVNYRQLLAVLEFEIRRAGRTERPFALLFVDVDELKRINDRYGHLAGSRALCRVAEALRLTCRSVDTAARYGGDEFALVLPETDEMAARRVARRVAERLERDPGEPRVTASLGVAVYPRDGATAEALLGAADVVLYRRKARRGRNHRSRRRSQP
jgi:diguanylate cyclase (GGDEF)-like protein